MTFVDIYLKPLIYGGTLSVRLSRGFDRDGCSLLVLLGPGQFPLLAFTDWEYHANFSAASLRFSSMVLSLSLPIAAASSTTLPTFVSSFLRASPSSLVSEGPKTPS